VDDLVRQPTNDEVRIERAALWLFRAKTARLKAEDAAYAQRVWHDILDQRDRDAWIHYAQDMLADLGMVATEPLQTPDHGCCWAHAGNRPDLSLDAPTICTRAEENQPWRGTARLAENVSNLQRVDDDANTPVRSDALLQHALDTSIRYSLERMWQRTEPSRPTPPEPQP
jgi:hypothetical protein